MKSIALCLTLFLVGAVSADEKDNKKLADLGAKLKSLVKSGKMTEKEAWTKYFEMAKKLGIKMKSMKKSNYGTSTFYSIIVGRLKTKDIEVGELTMKVDYITSIYGNRQHKDKILGKTVKVVGVSGAWLDKLLLIKKGETLKVRSGTLQGTTISLSPKATVLERTTPFDPKVYPIPPKEFRGFQGVVTGKIMSKSDQGYELTLKVDKVVKVAQQSKAKKPSVIVGRLLDLRGFYFNDFRKKFDDLRIGDTIRLGIRHADPTIDPLDVTQSLEKLDK